MPIQTSTSVLRRYISVEHLSGLVATAQLNSGHQAELGLAGLITLNMPNDRVRDLLAGKQNFVKDLREFNALYVAARRKGVQTCRFKLSNTRFAVVAEGLYDRKIQFIAAGNVYYTRPKELTCLLKAAEKAGICLDHSTINKSTNPRIVRVASANKDESGVRK